MGSQNSSAGFLLARNAKASGAAFLVGRPTGGNLRGLNGGQLAWLTLPETGVAVDIPLLAHFTEGEPPDAGVLPDLRLGEDFADEVAGIDVEMVAAQRQITRWRTAARAPTAAPGSAAPVAAAPPAASAPR